MQVNKKLAAVIGSAAAITLLSFTSSFEGTKLTTYRDIGGVLTYCTGETENAEWGQTYTPAECAEKLDATLAKHAVAVQSCIHVPIVPGQMIAFTDAAYNFGDEAFCHSSIARLTNLNHRQAGCDALLLYDHAAGRVIPGLLRRRQAERQYCQGDFDSRFTKG